MTAAGTASTASSAIAEPAQDRERPAPSIEARDRRRSPEAAGSHSCEPPSTAAEHRGDRANAAAADDVDLDAGFLERAHRAGVVRAVGARAGEQQGRSSFW